MTTIKKAPRGLYALKTNFTPEAFRLLTNFPGFSKLVKRELHFRPSSQTMEFVELHWPDADWEEECDDFRLKNLETKRIADENMANKSADHFDDSGYEYARPPMDHQAKAFAISRERLLFAYFMEQGTGKTKVTIDTATWLYEKGEIDCLVVVAWPNGVHRSWIEEEIPKDLPNRVKHSKEFWDSAVINKTKRASIQAVLEEDNFSIITFNVEAFSSQRAKDCLQEFLETRKCMFVIDQSACIKTWTAKRTSFLIKMSEKADYKRILDGDPATEGAEELFSQMYFLDPLIIGCDTWTNFKATYCRIGKFNNVTGYIDLDVLLSKIEPYVFRAREEECLDLPRRSYNRWRFDLSNEERRVYTDFMKKDIALLNPEKDDDGVMESNLALVKNMRLQQISSGWFRDDDTKELIQINKDKPSRLKAFVDWDKHIQGDKALIFCRFKADIYALEELLGSRSVSYHGGVNSDDRAEAKYRFMNEDGVQYFLGQYRAASIGHTLTAAKHVAFYTNEASLRYRTEAEKRAHRNGLQNTLAEGERLQIWDFMANKTKDAATIRALRNKRDLASVIMGDPYSFFLIEDDDDAV